MVDTTRGSIRVRSWPRPRPGDRHPTNEYWTKWLKAATFLYRYQPASWQAQLQAQTKGTVWMPRDVFISAMRGRAWLLQDENGIRYHPLAYVKDVSESLDAINQFPGGMLFRGTDLWIAMPGGSAGQLLTYVDDANPPVWADPTAFGYQSIRLLGGRQTAEVYAVNSTNYQFFQALTFNWDWDEFPFTHFRIAVSGNSNQAGQTITCQIAQNGSLNSPLSSGGNDLVVNSTPSLQSTGWIAVANPKTGFFEHCLTLKGSNGTVDLAGVVIEIHVKAD